VTGTDRPTVRQTHAVDWQTRRPFVVKLEGGMLYIRPKMTRRWYAVPITEIWFLAGRIRHQELKQEKAARRAERRAARR